jgi:imidazolonepropionase-like amidohydrolase
LECGGGVMDQGLNGENPQMTLEEIKAVVETARDYGFAVAAHAHGTDAGVFPHGENAHEFELMVEAGMPQMFVLQAATINAAQLLRREKDMGSITQGKYADVVAINGNPLDNISLMKQVSFVMKEGVVYKVNSAPLL